MDQKNDMCRSLGEALIDYADGCLDAQGQVAVDAHLAGCKTCRRRLWALRRSLELIRQDRDALARRPAPAGRWWRVPGVAAGLVAAAVCVVALTVAWQRTHTPAPLSVASEATAAQEMTLAVQQEDAAARLLFAAQQMASVSSLRADAERSSEYIRNNYANTAAGRSLRAGPPKQGVTQ
jgi:hypothetical protein